LLATYSRRSSAQDSLVARTLYSGTKNASSWAFRAWLALKEAAVAFEEIVVDIRRPQRFENLNRIGELSPPAAVPVLVEDRTVIFDSLAIMEYANDLSEGLLLPRDPKMRARARSFVAWQHAGMSSLCARLSFESAFYPEKRAMTFDERHQAKLIFDSWEAALRESSGPYLFGKLSLADLALVPSVMRLTSHTPDLSPWPAMVRWTDELMRRPFVQEWLSEANSLPVVRLPDYMP
jgi:glutathione S-transferase